MPTTVYEPGGGPETTYILVHLDDAEMSESLVDDIDSLDAADYAFFRARAAASVRRVAGRCGHRVNVVDPMAADPAFGGPTLGGKGFPGWREAVLDNSEVSKVARMVSPGSPVVVAGFARHDCVRRAAAALERAGCRVEIHDAGTLPLTARALRAPDSMPPG